MTVFPLHQVCAYRLDHFVDSLVACSLHRLIQALAASRFVDLILSAASTPVRFKVDRFGLSSSGT